LDLQDAMIFVRASIFQESPRLFKRYPVLETFNKYFKDEIAFNYEDNFELVLDE